MEGVNIDEPKQVVFLDIGQSNDSTNAGRLSEDIGAEESSPVTVEQIFQNMRQREMEILLRSGFPETNGQAQGEMAVDKSEKNGEGNEKKEKEEIMTLGEGNKQNSAAALSSKLNLSGDDKARSQPVLQVEEKLQKIGQKDIQTSTLLMSGSETQSEPDKMTVEEFFRSIRQHDVNILVSSGYPGASYHELDSEDSAYEIVHNEELRNYELSKREDGAHIRDMIEEEIIQEETVESFSRSMLCLPCCYTKRCKRLYVKNKGEEKKEKRPGLLKRFRQSVSRIVRKRPE